MDTAQKAREALADLAGLSLFSELKQHPLLASLEKLLVREDPRPLKLIRSWASLMGASAKALSGCPDPSWAGAIAFLTVTADNLFTRAAEAGQAEQLPPLAYAAAKADLSRLSRLAAFDLAAAGAFLAEALRAAGLDKAAAAVGEEARSLEAAAPSPAWENPFHGEDWGGQISCFASYVQNHGAGIFAVHRIFLWDTEKSALSPARNPDAIRFANLSGYEDQRSIVISNTLRFLEGKAANNLLLYGDRGTGKSATVKALCNEYADRGLRLVEVKKSGLSQLSRILDALAGRALRFVIFIDDLSFENAGDSFTSLKALLEGGVEAKPANTIIYATSNRRHLVKENAADRPARIAGEVRAFDAMQEQLSLADRFGVTVIFSAPDQEQYLRIAEFIAEQRGLLPPLSESEKENDAGRRLFRENAIRWERWFNGRSPRTAVQYADWLAGGSGFPWE